MIRFLDFFSIIINLGYAVVFFWTFYTFLPLRRNRFIKILALVVSSPLSLVVIYSNDWYNLFGSLLGFVLYTAIFFRGKWLEKVTAVLLFYPTMIAVNYLIQNIGSRIFFWSTKAPIDSSIGWTYQQWLISTCLYIFFAFLRLLFWFFACWLLRKNITKQVLTMLTTKMWLLVDVLMLSSVIAIFTSINYMPEVPVALYSICGAAILSSFGCIYLVTYICNATRAAYRVQELEMTKVYYEERMNEEERVRKVYHDLKNHLLILQAQINNTQKTKAAIESLNVQIAGYENYYHTGNEFLDIIIRDKAQKAKAKEIDFSVSVSVHDGGFLEPLDISTIFGNALDNSIEACEKLSKDKRLITVKASRIRDMLVIVVENSMIMSMPTDGRTTKQDAFMHGFGILNIKKAVEKYDGQCTVKTAAGVFTLKIIVPIPAG